MKSEGKPVSAKPRSARESIFENRCGAAAASLMGIVAVIAVLLAVWWFFLRPSAEAKVRQQFEDLTALVSNPPADGLMGKAKVIGGFRDLFGDPVVIDSDSAGLDGVYSPDKLAGIYLSAIRSGATPDIAFDPGRIEFRETGEAFVTTVIEGTVAKAGGSPREETGRFKVELRDVDGEWLFFSFEEVN